MLHVLHQLIAIRHSHLYDGPRLLQPFFSLQQGLI